MSAWEEIMGAAAREAARTLRFCDRCGLVERDEHECPEPMPYARARAIADFHIATLVPMSPHTYARVKLALEEHARWWLRFQTGLKRRTQARLSYCSHRRWDMQREACLGCGYTRFEILSGRA